jgi:hypothetical protein
MVPEVRRHGDHRIQESRAGGWVRMGALRRMRRLQPSNVSEVHVTSRSYAHLADGARGATVRTPRPGRDRCSRP